MKTKQIYDYIERLSNLLRIDARGCGAQQGLQPIHIEVLHYLSICNRYSDTPMAVTEYLGLTKGTVSQTLKVLEKKGFIEKVGDINDKRVMHMKLSCNGKRLLQASIPSPLFVQACDHLSDDSQSQIISALNALLLGIQQSSGMKSFGVCHTCRYNRKNGDGSILCELAQEPLSEDDVMLICREHDNVSQDGDEIVNKS